MSNKPAPRCPGCGAEMELTEVSKHTWRYSCEDCGWRSPAVHGPGREGKEVAYAKAMKRWKPVYDVYQGTAHEQGWPLAIGRRAIAQTAGRGWTERRSEP